MEEMSTGLRTILRIRAIRLLISYISNQSIAPMVRRPIRTGLLEHSSRPGSYFQEESGSDTGGMNSTHGMERRTNLFPEAKCARI